MAGAIVVLPLDLHQNPRRQAVIRSPLLFSISQKSRRSCALRSMQLLTAHRPAAALKSPRRSRTGSPRTARGRNKRSGILPPRPRRLARRRGPQGTHHRQAGRPARLEQGWSSLDRRPQIRPIASRLRLASQQTKVRPFNPRAMPITPSAGSGCPSC